MADEYLARMLALPSVILTPSASFNEEQRVIASELATKRGRGLLMEIHSSHTEFYAVVDVPVGKVKVTASKSYKGMLQDVIVLDSPTQQFDYDELREWMHS